jgi:hypothetical protein
MTATPMSKQPESKHMRVLLAVAVFLIAGMAGCADTNEVAPTDAAPEVEVTSTTGGIRGVVVDDSITPVEGANIFLPTTGDSALTDAEGGFAFSRLEPGTYFIQATRFGYSDVQASVVVEAGIEKPPSVRIQMPKLDVGEPFDNTLKFDGFYECAFSLFFITDSCDMAARTAHDEGSPTPRHVQNNINTAFYTMEGSTLALIQEGFWDTSALPKFRASVASAPIDNLCDCSDTVFLESISDTGYTYGRLDNEGGAWPPVDGSDFAVRGFIPFASGAEVNYALNVKFELFTTFFENYQPAEGWNLEERDDYPRPS